MTLKEKFKKQLDTATPTLNRPWYQANKCEQIAEEFAISFGQWMTSGVEFIDDTDKGRIYNYRHKLYTTKQLLELYKKGIGV